MSTSSEKTVYRELGIRAVIRAIRRGESVGGESVDGYHQSTVRAAKRRIDSGYKLPNIDAAYTQAVAKE